MKTKITILSAFLVVLTSNVFGQATVNCAEKLSIFAEMAKTKNYGEETFKHLQELRKDCATLSEATYIYGERIYNFRIDNAKTPADKEKEVRELMKLEDEYRTHFPAKVKGIDVKKAMALFENNVGTSDEVYQLLDTAFKTDKDNFSNPKALYVYFEIYVNDFEAGKKGIKLQDIFTKYDEISDKIGEEEKVVSDALDALIQKEDSGTVLTDKENRYKENHQINMDAFETIRSSMDAKIAQLATCERLIPFLGASYEENKNNEEWLRRAAERLDRKGCSEDPLFSKISDALHKLNPTAESAYNLGVSFYSKKNTTKALEYFNQSAELQKDNTKKANVYYTIARNIYGNGNKVQARAYAEKALAAKPSMGEAHVYIAQLYANSANECGNDPFEKRAIYWLAAQTARKAGTTAGNNAAASYDRLAPSKQEIFNSGRAGQSISFKCWVGRSITVPSL
ncbi:tetratricopeptide repeat protein [Flavobacterium sp.]|uniref:tetratricopeptide repeat protein n=1 Tax=Flavobacterium sp. TaxID=239 RepID=UPI002603921F|nr:tetratricopeptide repeat protein [Flavobacterium sp.]MDD2985063.1 tetratricopeptide repeat protein [Flavobacterium sp.]